MLAHTCNKQAHFKGTVTGETNQYGDITWTAQDRPVNECPWCGVELLAIYDTGDVAKLGYALMETYLIAEVLNTGDWGILEEFEAEDDTAANAYADEHYSHIEWYVLDQSTQVNING